MNVAVPSGGLSVDMFADEAALIKALSVVRQAAIDPGGRDALRNDILAYAGEADGSKRDELKRKILTKISEYPELAALSNAAPNAAGTSMAGSAITSKLGQTRPAPAFTVSATPAPTTPEVPAAPAPEPKPVPPPAPSAPAMATPAPAPVAAEPVPIPQTPATPAPTAPTVPEPMTAAIPPASPNARARIDEIKRDINSRVGNPVNLINADETIGREYMSALLDAMKKTAQGGGADAMVRLETAYRTAIDLIASKGMGNGTGNVMGNAPVDTTPAAAPAMTSSPTMTASPAAAMTEPALPPTPPTPPVTTLEPEPLKQPEPEPTPAPEIIMPPPLPVQSEGLYHRPTDELEDPERHAAPVLGIASLAEKLFKADTKQKEPDKSPAPESRAVPSVRKVSVGIEAVSAPAEAPKPAATAAEQKLKPLQDTSAALPEKMASIKAEAEKRDLEAKKPITDLNAPEIDEGLRQLLSEWVLFKKSGFLGTGPAGIEHPLYKKLAPLPMAAVVSGRFEGVTPEIKRHLSDYMTGWRYEQGIAHEMGENFEHYLRRVIKQILTKQRMSIKTDAR